MTQRHSYAFVAGAATLLAAFPLSTIFASYTWLFYSAFGIGAVVGAAVLVRSARGPVWTQVLAMMAALLIYLTVVFPSGSEFIRLIPTVSTFQHFNDMLATAGDQIRTAAVPVPDYPGLLLLTTAGVGLVAILVDLAAVGLRRPALAGLPMLAIYSVPVAVLPQSMPVLPFVFAAVGFLWLLISDSVDRVRRFGRRFTGEGRDVELWEPSPLSSAGRRLGAVGLAIAMLLPLAVPDFTNGFLQRFNGPGGGSGIGPGNGPITNVNLNALITDNLKRDQIFDMVLVSTSDPNPFYLKFAVADEPTNAGFNNKAPTIGTSLDRGISPPVNPKVPGVTAQPYGATIQAVNFDMQLAPQYEKLTSVQNLGSDWNFDETTGQVFSRGASINGKSYKIEFEHTAYTAAALRAASPLDNGDAGSRSLVAIQQIPEVSDLVSLLTKGKTTEYDRVRAIYDYFSPSNGFSYTLNAPPAKTGYAVLDFLAVKKGFCVQYAAALAWLVRAAGIPARVAFGFTRGANAGANQITHLTNINLHAWTEVFFPGFGWVPFDATPAGSVTGSFQPAYAPDLANPNAAGDGGQDDLAPKAGQSATASPLAGADIQAPLPGPTFTRINPLLFAGAALVLIMLFLALLPALRRRALRRARRVRPGPAMAVEDTGGVRPSSPDLVYDPAVISAARLDAHAAWAELIDTMLDFDVLVDEAETPRATAARLRKLPAFEPAAQDAAGLVARAEERARYAATPLRPDGLDTAVHTVRVAMRERATRQQRILAAVLPRSVTLRWRATWVGWASRLVRTAGRLREALGVVNPRRLLASRR